MWSYLQHTSTYKCHIHATLSTTIYSKPHHSILCKRKPAHKSTTTIEAAGTFLLNIVMAARSDHLGRTWRPPSWDTTATRCP
jgi:hypothetical protein